MGKLPVPTSAWKQYVEQGKLIESGLSHIILESWQRSNQQNINPYHISLNDVLERNALQERREINRQLIDAATPIMMQLYSVLKGGNFIILLADTQGYILQSFGDPGFEDKARKICLSDGANWHESVRGTNAIGTALANRSVVNVFASEHYCRENHFLTCSAAPIFDPQGEIAGILNISSHYRLHEPHLLGSVVAAAQAIENRLLLENTQKQLVTTYLQLSSIMDVVPEGLMVIDTEGYIARINQKCSYLFGVSQQECIGQPIDTIFNNANQWIGDMQKNNGILNRTATIENSNGKLQTFSVRIGSDEQKNYIGVFAKATHGTCSEHGPYMHNTYYFSDIIGNSPAIRETKRYANIAARSDSTVLLQGESGTGKEMFAQAIHNASSRSSGPFIPVNCGAIPMNLLESELFGYEDGAFTGAKKGGQPGKFEQARGGTIFLDEIGEMPLNFQVSLLRIIQEKQVIRIGGTTPIPLDVRIIAASNKDLESEVKKMNFRLDLYYRLNVLTIDIPALRDRKEDILMLTQFFLDRLSEKLGKNRMTISSDLCEWLEYYEWPGNVRELENTLERAINFAEKDVLDCDDLPYNLRKMITFVPFVVKNDPLKLKDREYYTIHEALTKAEGNMAQAARLLGIGRSTLYRKIQKYSIPV